ncbi:MAG: sugar kinase [Deltaproteobacteria bacterium]|nr:sugar kinase [Deltaproteobacteria bacterium]MBW2015328.1 sugar kinase [Deltaproteobacteria bacterium]MBW2128189.1 sugar kinase [Deltaproteobacteria bacterium]
MKHAPQIRVVGLGQACVDYLGRVNKFPAEDEKVELEELVMQCGGPASTALVVLARLGVKVAFIGVVSDDPFGVKIQKELELEGIDSTYLKTVPGFSSQFAFIAVTRDNGHRTIFWHRGTVPSLNADDVDLSPFSAAEILHLDGLMIEASIEAARQARRMGMRIVLDAGTMREGSLELVSMVDVLIASERFAEPIVGKQSPPEQTLAALRRLGPRQVVLTLGEKGSMALDHGMILFQRAFPVEAVDTTGAGDVYHGGYIYGLLKGWHMADCMRFASAASALKCRMIGARKGIPGYARLQEFLEIHKDIKTLRLSFSPPDPCSDCG